MSEARSNKNVIGKTVLSQVETESGADSDVILLGIDLGTSRSSVVALNGVRKTIDSYVGYPKDAVSRKMLKTDVLFGKSALDNRLRRGPLPSTGKGCHQRHLRRGRRHAPMKVQKNLTAAQDLHSSPGRPGEPRPRPADLRRRRRSRLRRPVKTKLPSSKSRKISLTA